MATGWQIGTLALVALGAVILVLALFSWFPFQDDELGTPEPGSAVPAIADGDWFGFVTVGRDESDAITLGVDLAEMLTGQKAHDAAVEAGVITDSVATGNRGWGIDSAACSPGWAPHVRPQPARRRAGRRPRRVAPRAAAPSAFSTTPLRPRAA